MTSMETTTDTSPVTLRVPAAKLPRLEARLADLAKVATRLGVEPLRLEVLSSDEVTTRHPLTGHEVTDLVHEVAVHGATPRLPGGWVVIGAVEHLEAGDLVHGDDPRVSAFRGRGPVCDHCGTRRNRSKTVLVADEAGTVAQVGVACLQDFTGYGRSPEGLWSLLADVEALERDLDEGAGWASPLAVGTRMVLTLAAAAIRTHGWTPKSAGRGVPTAALVTRLAFGPYRPLHKSDEEWELAQTVQRDEADEATGLAAAAWVASLDAKGSDYLLNLKVAAAGDTVEARHFGLAVSAVPAYLKEQGRLAERERQAAATKDSAHLGTVGERLTLQAKVTFVRAFPGDYGTSYLVTMVTPDGDVIKTFSSGQFGADAEAGDEVTIKGTVKAHEVYNDRQETMLTRVKDLTPRPDPASFYGPDPKED